MPRRSVIRTTALDELARQLRFTPVKAALRQLARIEELAVEIDPVVNYPEEWVIFRITGYRSDTKRSSSQDDSEYQAALIPGEAVIRDLSALAERISEETGVTPGVISEPVFGLDEVCARWNVSRRTLERYRRRGLIARRVRTGPGHVRTVMTQRVIERFERANTSILGHASSYRRLSREQRECVIERAKRYRTRLGWSLNQTANRLAIRSGRGRETMRQILLQHDESSDEPIFARPGVLSPRDKRAIVRAWARGVSPTAIAAHFERSRASVHRVINQRRMDRLRRIDLSGVVDESFEQPHASELVLAHPVVRHGLGRALPTSVPEVIELARDTGPIDFEVEHHRALALCYLRWRAKRAMANIGRRAARSTEIDRIETDLRWALRLKAELLRAELPLIVRNVEESLGRAIDPSAGGDANRLMLAFDAASGAITRHDPIKGGRLAAPVSLAVARRIASPGQAQRAPEWSITLESWATRLEPDPRLHHCLHALPEELAKVAAWRFGWFREGVAEGSPPMTVGEIANRLNMTPQRVLRRLRSAMRLARGLGSTGKRES